MMWDAEFLLRKSIIAANVVDLPEPLAPTMRIRPRRSMIMSFRISGMPSASSCGNSGVMKRSTIATLPRWWNTLTRNRPRPASEIAKSISRSFVNCSSCCSFMSSSAAWRTIFGVSST